MLLLTDDILRCFAHGNNPRKNTGILFPLGYAFSYTRVK